MNFTTAIIIEGYSDTCISITVYISIYIVITVYSYSALMLMKAVLPVRSFLVHKFPMFTLQRALETQV